MSKLKLVPIENPIFIKMRLGDSVVLSAGSESMLCEKFGVGRPILVGTLHLLIQDKYRVPCTEIAEAQFNRELSRCEDSHHRVILI